VTRTTARFVAFLIALTAIAGCGADEPKSKAVDYETALAGAPPRLAALHAQANELLPGGADAFKARLRELRGHPVVVNKWASWCGPCRLEFPFFQSLAANRGKRIAFLGINSNDGENAARDFLDEFPVPYPSYVDPKLEVAKVIDATTEFPATAFYDRRGRLTRTHLGPYTTEADLATDIRRYAR
jgi:cytochrome c biogenesis protein CcmG, thiol:disulfide interchange protein DsbE